MAHKDRVPLLSPKEDTRQQLQTTKTPPSYVEALSSMQRMEKVGPRPPCYILGGPDGR